MSSNKNGLNGLDVEQIALEKSILVGVQSPNTIPAIKTDLNGKSLPQVEISPNGGSQVYQTSGYDCSYADTSWISRIGVYSVTSGNTMIFNTGTGGFSWHTDGPCRIKTCYQDFWCENAFSLQTRLFKVNTTERAHLMGTRLDLEFDEIVIQGNTSFTNNVIINGGLFVNGELYATHITTQKQQFWTEESTNSTAFVNPNQSFTVIDGNSTSALATVPTMGINAMITIDLPVVGNLVNFPCRIKFPNGVSLISDATVLRSAGAAGALIATGQVFDGADIPDVIGQGHSHAYFGPAVNLKDSTTDVWADAADVIPKNTPTPAKESVPNGEETLDIVKDKILDLVKKRAENFLTSFWDSFKAKLFG